MSVLFGPVPSRRLGFSLGVDIVPLKTCTLDCLYCQVAGTTDKTITRSVYVNAEEVVEKLRAFPFNEHEIDYITFSGSGEPTLNAQIGTMIAKIKDICSIPVAVLTNGTLMYMPDVREDLMHADLVVPSLDTVSSDVFKILNRPHADLTVEHIIEGLSLFAAEFTGSLWIEVMIVKDVNDSQIELEGIADILRKLKPEKIQINSVSRPSAAGYAEKADAHVLERARHLFGDTAEIIMPFRKEGFDKLVDGLDEDIVMMLRRRPCSLEDIARALGAQRPLVQKIVNRLVDDGLVSSTEHNGSIYYSCRR